MRRRLAVIASALSLLAAVPVVQASPQAAGPVAVAAKSCSGGYVHGIIGGAHKCLRRGQYCAHRYDRQYHRYGFHCHKRDARGSYHLT